MREMLPKIGAGGVYWFDLMLFFMIASRREAVGTTKQEAPSRSWVGFVMSQKENPKNLYVRSVLGQGLCHRRQVSSSSVSLSVCSVCVRLDGGNARAGTHNTLSSLHSPTSVISSKLSPPPPLSSPPIPSHSSPPHPHVTPWVTFLKFL